QKDNATKVILMIGEVGSTLEQDVASVYAKMKKRKPLVTYVAGAYVPDKTYMGNIGAIVKTKEQSAEFKKTALKKAGAVIVESPDEMGEAVAEVMAHLKEKEK
ncbi:MAG: succinate--CoA ligase subunit alpha, partial [Alphaproteobacteria bacterium]|nr:succinate--CoA ligase subunit alpha [Alphaproteobacteria bacterium]